MAGSQSFCKCPCRYYSFGRVSSDQNGGFPLIQLKIYRHHGDRSTSQEPVGVDAERNEDLAAKLAP